MAKQFLLRSEVLKKMRELERNAELTGDPVAVEYAAKAYRAVMSTAIEKKIYCQNCARKLEQAVKQ